MNNGLTQIASILRSTTAELAEANRLAAAADFQLKLDHLRSALDLIQTDPNFRVGLDVLRAKVDLGKRITRGV